MDSKRLLHGKDSLKQDIHHGNLLILSLQIATFSL